MSVHPPDNAQDLTDPPFYLPQFEAAYRYIIEEYTVFPRETAIFIPCAVRKPYSSSPSHQLFHRLFAEVSPDPAAYHVVIFGTCGTVPAELELMYPFAHYHYMLGNVKDQRIKDDFSVLKRGEMPDIWKRRVIPMKRELPTASAFFGHLWKLQLRRPEFLWRFIRPDR